MMADLFNNIKCSLAEPPVAALTNANTPFVSTILDTAGFGSAVFVGILGTIFSLLTSLLSLGYLVFMVLTALKAHKGEGHQALQQRLQEARWFIKNIQQRFDTILRVSRAIVERQKNFFTHGELAMRPLVLRDIADELGLHESTISRVTTAKYMATPQGTFELKYFFGSSLNTEAGGNASSTAVRALIQKDYNEAFTKVDAILMPATPSPAPATAAATRS